MQDNKRLLLTIPRELEKEFETYSKFVKTVTGKSVNSYIMENLVKDDIERLFAAIEILKKEVR